eukprot:1016708-Rhodomonas_salina.1
MTMTPSKRLVREETYFQTPSVNSLSAISSTKTATKKSSDASRKRLKSTQYPSAHGSHGWSAPSSIALTRIATST